MNKRRSPSAEEDVVYALTKLLIAMLFLWMVLVVWVVIVG